MEVAELIGSGAFEELESQLGVAFGDGDVGPDLWCLPLPEKLMRRRSELRPLLEHSLGPLDVSGTSQR